MAENWFLPGPMAILAPLALNSPAMKWARSVVSWRFQLMCCQSWRSSQRWLQNSRWNSPGSYTESSWIPINEIRGSNTIPSIGETETGKPNTRNARNESSTSIFRSEDTKGKIRLPEISSARSKNPELILLFFTFSSRDKWETSAFALA